MTSPTGLALVALGCLIIVLAAVGAAVVGGDVFTRLHFLTPVTSLGVPFVAVGLSVQSGFGFTAAELLFIAAMLFVAGPALEIATGRVAAQRAGLSTEASPE
jgi:multicomponent Na+:H+ antiporter subunit G